MNLKGIKIDDLNSKTASNSKPIPEQKANTSPQTPKKVRHPRAAKGL